MSTYKVLIPTHSKTIYLLSLSLPSNADDTPRTPSILTTLTLPEQPSHALQHPTHKNLLYVTSWVENKIFLIEHGVEDDGTDVLRVVEERGTGGEGPTYFVMTPNKDGLLVVHYRSGHLNHIPLDPTTGHFISLDPLAASDILQLPYQTPQNFASPREADRQASSHPHHLVPIPPLNPADGLTDYLVPDLGGDRIFCVRFEDGEWTILSSTKVPDGNGPRHVLIRPDPSGEAGKHLVYLVYELSSHLAVFTLEDDPNDRSPQIALLVGSYPTLPADLQKGGKKAYTPTGPYEAIACTILDTEDGDVLVSNRNADVSVAPERDSIVVFPELRKSGSELSATQEPYHLVGAGRHLRAMSLDPTGKWLIVISREGDGLSIYTKKKGEEGSRWSPVVERVLVGETDLAVGMLFLEE